MVLAGCVAHGGSVLGNVAVPQAQIYFYNGIKSTIIHLNNQPNSFYLELGNTSPWGTSQENREPTFEIKRRSVHHTNPVGGPHGNPIFTSLDFF